MSASGNFYAALEAKARATGAGPAIAPPGGAALSYAGLADDVARMARALERLGVKAGDRVTAQVDKSIPNVCLYLATLKTGAIFNPLNTAYTAAELDYFVGDAEPALVVMPESKLAQMAKRAAGVAYASMEADGTGSLLEAARGQSADYATRERDTDDIAALLYTSGTTGRSKGAMITHGNLSSNAHALHKIWDFKPGDVLLHALPIFHVHGLFVALHTAMLNGSRMLWLDKFDLAEVLRLLPEATVMMGVPTFYTRLLAQPEFGTAMCRNMRLFVSGSAPLLAETHREFEARTGQRILERYGMTEAGMITSNPCVGGERVAGTVGYALPDVSLRVVDENQRVLGAGEVGVLEVKGPNVFKGYWRNPEKTREDFREDGYFITGDMATMAADGRVTIVGRAKDLIITGGFNVYPKEVEGEINSLPGVAESAVVGVPHPDFGEGIVAVLTPLPGQALPSEDEVLKSLSTRLAKFKLPKRVFAVDALPRNAMGKVQKNELSARYRETFKVAAKR